MLISNETDYAFRLLRSLADGRKHTMRELCEEEAVPQQFAYKIIRKLADGGLIRSTRGVHGGVELVCDLGAVTMFDVVEMTDADRYVTDCMRPGNHCTWRARHCSRCTVHRRIREIQEKLDAELRSCTIADLLGGSCADAE